MSAAKWHRDEATAWREQAAHIAKIGDKVEACNRMDIAAHHATAADALEALAVGRLPSILDRMWGIGGVYGLDLTAEERAALATLARIAEEASRG